MLFTFLRYLVAKKEKMENSKENDNKNKADSEAANKTAKEDDPKIGIEMKKLEQALKNSRIEQQVIIRVYLFSMQLS